MGGDLAPAVDWGPWVGLGPALLVAAPAPAAEGGWYLDAVVSTFSGSLGLRAAACTMHAPFVIVFAVVHMLDVCEMHAALHKTQ